MIENSVQRGRLGEIASVFLRLGFTAFGGPAAALAMMRQEVVLKRKWLAEDEFLDFWGISNLVPGPNATEMAIHLGYRYAGWLGLILAGVCYIIPAMAIVLGLAWAYVEYGSLPALTGILEGIKPVVVAILLWALWGMLRPRFNKILGLVITGAVLVGYLWVGRPILWLVAGGAVMWLLYLLKSNKTPPPLVLAGVPLLVRARALLRPLVPFNLWRLFWVFLKAGSLMYGSGYVLLVFIQDDLVNMLGWLTQSQLLDAIAVGQVTPGPLATTATFVGYLTGGLAGAALATLGMFLPGFLFVLLTHPLLRRMQESVPWRHFLDGVNFAALGLMAGVIWDIARTVALEPLGIGVGVVSLLLLVIFELPAPWLILGGAVVGVGKVLLGF
ncbi:MAG: chromate efflux transporter [Anaerolineaceae bacterium]|nr:chromate efflux transporter [Anaerolineaceae bacterium]